MLFMFNVTSHIYTHAGSWMAAFASHPKLQLSHSRALFLICRAYLLFKHNLHFCRVYDMFTPFNTLMQMHLLASSYTFMHYINVLHCGNQTNTYPWSGIGAITLKSFKSLTRQRPVCSRHRDLCSLKTFKNFTPRKLYEMTNHLLQQIESQCHFKCQKTCQHVDIQQSYNARLKSLKMHPINSGAF